MKLPIQLSLLAVLFLMVACKKQQELPINPTDGFTGFIIPKGQHYCLGNVYKPIETKALKFMVRFDSSARYTTVDPQNQFDINKLYGFSDNNWLHQQYSARIGWRWSNNALRLFGYIYNNGVRAEQEITTVGIDVAIPCSIEVAGNAYIFSVNDKKISMPRASTAALAKGYRLYPYFGGDEVAPHQVTIWIKEE